MALADLFGVWRLTSLRFVTTDTGESRDMYGADPLGCLFLTPDQRMVAVITAKDRTASDGDGDLFRSMMAYSGAFRIEGDDQFVTRVEVSWHPEWVGTEQARTFSVDGDHLSITTAELTHPTFPGRPGRGVLAWTRASRF